MAMSATIPLVASSLSGPLFPKNYKETKDFGYTMIIGFWTCAFSLVCVVFLAVLDNKTETHDKIVLQKYIENERMEQNTGNSFHDKSTFNKLEEQQEDEENFSCKDIKIFGVAYYFTIISCTLTYICITNFVVISAALL